MKILILIFHLLMLIVAAHKSANRLKGIHASIWTKAYDMREKYKPMDLGQGYSTIPLPSYLTKALANVTTSSDIMMNQYTRIYGHPRFVKILAKLYSTLLERPIDPYQEVLATGGANEALYIAVMAHVDPGDEVIIIEPFFTGYPGMVQLAGGVPVYIPLTVSPDSKQPITGEDWKLDMGHLEAKFSERTKMIILNTPHNPSGKMYTREELTAIANLCKRYDVIVLFDEVYQWTAFTGFEHLRMANLPGMWERTIAVGSAGKVLGPSGWKLGWAYGPKSLIHPMQILHDEAIFSCPTPLQEAFAIGLELEFSILGQPNNFFVKLPQILKKQRNKLFSYFQEQGMRPTKPNSAMYMLANISSLVDKVDLSTENGETKCEKFSYWLTKNVKVQGIPLTSFYSKEHRHLAEDYMRFCYMRDDDTLEAVGFNLKKLKSKLRRN